MFNNPEYIKALEEEEILLAASALVVRGQRRRRWPREVWIKPWLLQHSLFVQYEHLVELNRWTFQWVGGTRWKGTASSGCSSRSACIVWVFFLALHLLIVKGSCSRYHSVRCSMQVFPLFFWGGGGSLEQHHMRLHHHTWVDGGHEPATWLTFLNWTWLRN